jgi:mannose-1-phosphate guanylyltransferase
MVPVLNRPFIEHVMSRLASHDIKEIVLAMGYKPDTIYEYFKNGTGLELKLIYSLEDKPLGTAGAIKHADKYIDSTFFVLNGDTYSDIDYTEMLRFHKNSGATATIALTHVEDPTKFGVVETDEGGRIKAFIEKPTWDRVTSHWINAGVYILEPEVLNYIPKDKFCMFEHNVFPQMLADDKHIFAFSSEAYWIDMGTPEKYHQLNRDLLMGKCKPMLSINDKIGIPADSQIHPSVRQTGYIMIGHNCKIDREVEFCGPVIIGRGCHINRKAVIKNSILWDNIVVGEGAMILNSIIASGAKIKEKVRLDGETLNYAVPDSK